MRKLAVVLASALFVLTAVSVFAIDITMKAQNNSGQDGTVTIEAVGNQTRVTVNIKAGAAGVSQPAHIHEGTCAPLGGVTFPLTSVVDGKSTTMLDTPLATIQSQQRAVNVHKSAAEAAVFVSCGEIPLATGAAPGAPVTAPAPTTLPRTGGLPVAMFALLGAGLLGAGTLVTLAFRRR